MRRKLKSILGAALALCLMAGLAVPAGAYTAEVSELSSVTPSSSYVEVSSCNHYDGEHPLYIFPAGTTFQSAGYMVVQAWKIEADTGALDFYDSDYDSGSDGATFAPEAGVIYMIQESNQMDWFQYMYIMVEGGASQQPEPTGYEVPDNSLLEASSASVGTATVTDWNGESHTVYRYPAGTVFTPKIGMTNFSLAKNLYTGEVQYLSQKFTLPGDGAYELTAYDQGIWDTKAYVMADGASIPEPEPEPEIVAGFADVPTTAWYAGYVQTVVDKGLFSGKGEGVFGAEDQMTYAEFLVVLSQFSGDAIPGSAGAWYQGYVDWASNAGIVPAEIAGFNPDAAITRQDMAALFGNFLNAYDHEGQPSAGEPSFADGASVADYAAEGVTLCYQMGLMSGKDGNRFDPLATATRAEVAVTMTQMARVMGR